jgi:spermidine/putrescine-binding protein
MTRSATANPLWNRRHLFGAAAGLALPFAPNRARADTGVVRAAVWTGAFHEALQTHVFRPFQAATGIAVEAHPFGNHSAILAALRAGEPRLDLVFMSDPFVQRGVRHQLLRPIDRAAVPNFDGLHERLKLTAFDPGPDIHSCIYLFGANGLVYDTRIGAAPDSWSALWDTRHAGKIIVHGAGAAPIRLAAHVVGQDFNTITDLDQISAKLMALAPGLLSWWNRNDEAHQYLTDGKARIGEFWHHRVKAMAAAGAPLAYALPREGVTGWAEVMAVPTAARNPRGAEALIDFVLDREVQSALVAGALPYLPANRLAQAPEKFAGAAEVAERVTFIDADYLSQNIDEWLHVIGKVRS